MQGGRVRGHLKRGCSFGEHTCKQQAASQQQHDVSTAVRQVTCVEIEQSHSLQTGSIVPTAYIITSALLCTRHCDGALHSATRQRLHLHMHLQKPAATAWATITATPWPLTTLASRQHQQPELPAGQHSLGSASLLLLALLLCSSAGPALLRYAQRRPCSRWKRGCSTRTC